MKTPADVDSSVLAEEHRPHEAKLFQDDDVKTDCVQTGSYGSISDLNFPSLLCVLLCHDDHSLNAEGMKSSRPLCKN